MILSVLNEKPMYTAREDQMTSNQNLKKKINYFLQKKKILIQNWSMVVWMC